LEQALSAAQGLATLSGRGRIVPELNNPTVREVFVFRYRLLYEVEGAYLDSFVDVNALRRAVVGSTTAVSSASIVEHDTPGHGGISARGSVRRFRVSMLWSQNA
jgi:hypothetical protein